MINAVHQKPLVLAATEVSLVQESPQSRKAGLTILSAAQVTAGFEPLPQTNQPLAGNRRGRAVDRFVTIERLSRP
jgi:hypothetical protein